MSTPQEYWDACLIRTWRQSGSVLDAMMMFKSITKIQMEDVEPKLLRIPKDGFPWKTGVKVFIASHLSKISNRLWDQPPEKDVALLKKLKDSKKRLIQCQSQLVESTDLSVSLQRQCEEMRVTIGEAELNISQCEGKLQESVQEIISVRMLNNRKDDQLEGKISSDLHF